MNMLLDTNALLWAAYGPQMLTKPASEGFMSADRIVVSIISLWEVGLKMSRGGFGGLKVPENWEQDLWS